MRGDPSHRARSEGADEPTDWVLVERSGSGDAVAFRRLVERHQNRIVRLCRRLLGDREEARDVAQDVFLELFQRAARLEPRSRLYTWLYRVATNRCLNRLRRRRIVRMIGLGGSGETPPSIEATLPDGAPGAAQSLLARERWRRTRTALEELPASQRLVVLLVKLEGLSYREAAESLGISVGAVESRLFRAMRRLEKAQGEAASEVS